MQLASPQTQIGRPKTSIKKSVGNVNAPPEQEPEGKLQMLCRVVALIVADNTALWNILPPFPF